ncbi:MAG: hypothetical protein CW716_06310 [Candidatus Bathyarchaeum sp.]|nr:MAG: hypothetical protein CW716_06310 [Candidatus Bathyarchaeum sp.]
MHLVKKPLQTIFYDYFAINYDVRGFKLKKSAATVVAEKKVEPSLDKNLSVKGLRRRKQKHSVVRRKIGKK